MQETLRIPMNRLYQKFVQDVEVKNDVIKSPEDGLNIVKDLIGNADREHFVTLSLNTKNKVISMDISHIGSLNQCTVHPREIFKNAVLSNAAVIFLAHNHPSGVTTPSNEDIEFTKRLVDAGEIMGIEVLDHIIVNDQDEYCSMKEINIIN